MGEQTAISWTDHTFNPWHGCWKIDPECQHCYAESLSDRFTPGLWGRTNPRRFFGDAHWNEPRKWNRKAKADGVRRRVFVGSMCDWAEVHPVDEVFSQQESARARLFKLIDECDALDWLLLTKRPEDAAKHLPWGDGEPWPHVWVGVTAGSLGTLTRNVPVLRRIPAAVRFISCEPLLENIPGAAWRDALAPTRGEGPIHWLIVGNESGHKRRTAEMDWVRTARDEAARYGVSFHFKQWVLPNGKKIHLPVLDGQQHAAFPNTTKEAPMRAPADESRGGVSNG